MLQTERLILRQWSKDDFLPFSKINNNKEAMEFFTRLLTQEESYKMAGWISSLIEQRGWGFWAVEVAGLKKFIGFVGLHTPSENLPFAPCVEIGWRLAKDCWGQGYATEGARESLRYAFEELNLDEVFSLTAVANTRSRNVMEKIGMKNTHDNFMHPDIEQDHPHCEHVLYRVTKPEWKKQTSV